ncbi:Translational regulator orb2 [Amphibalanus amphitrite]|uniref:Translational regulator orb2 n=1 Tax=Amphibalanus amphitrite TaxID=1232801 RepID=A0A6A4VPJ0_AMPAM|nr:Translational regulator orb2 [Amphibalanus amphitrite]
MSTICSDIPPATSCSRYFGNASQSELKLELTNAEKCGLKMQSDLRTQKSPSKSPNQSLASDQDVHYEENQRFCEDGKNVLGLSNVLVSNGRSEDELSEKCLTSQSGVAYESGASGLSSSFSLSTSIHASQSFTESSSAMNGSSGGSPPNLWSTTSADQSIMGRMQAANGAQYPSHFPSHTQMHASNQNALIGGGCASQYNIASPSLGQRRQVTAAHNMTPSQTQKHYVDSKSYPAWSAVSGSQHNSWGVGVQPQQNLTAMPNWNRVPKVSNHHQVPMTHFPASMSGNSSSMAQKYNSFSQAGGAVVFTPNKFRGTSFPSKGPYGQPPPSQDARGSNMLLGYQDRSGLCSVAEPSPLDTMRSLEHYLTDMVRGCGDAGYLNGGGNGGVGLHSLGQLQGKPPFFPGLDEAAAAHLLEGVAAISPCRTSPRSAGSADNGERYSRKVFVGGLPPDIDEEEITASFRRFGPLVVDWPHKAESKSYFPPKGYAFLLFQDESSVQQLIDTCIQDDDKLYLCVSSPTIKDKPVQIRPWKLSDADFVRDASLPLDPRKTVFVGGVPRPLKAVELAMIMDRLYGGVCYAGIDTDPELKYPKGAGRVAFSNQQSYIAAISARFVQLQHGDIDKRVEVKPYVLDDQMCDECQGVRCSGKFAPFFCANVTCLQYYCEHCWATIHSRPGREFHKPLVKEGADRPRAVPYRWC